MSDNLLVLYAKYSCTRIDYLMLISTENFSGQKGANLGINFLISFCLFKKQRISLVKKTSLPF